MPTVLEIPVRHDLESYSFTIELEKKNYLMRFRFNRRATVWTMDIAKTDGTDILSGLPVLTNTDLIGRFQIPDLPPGQLMAYDESGAAADAALADLGANVKLLYRSAS